MLERVRVQVWVGTQQSGHTLGSDASGTGCDGEFASYVSTVLDIYCDCLIFCVGDEVRAWPGEGKGEHRPLSSEYGTYKTFKAIFWP